MYGPSPGCAQQINQHCCAQSLALSFLMHTKIENMTLLRTYTHDAVSQQLLLVF